MMPSLVKGVLGSSLFFFFFFDSGLLLWNCLAQVCYGLFGLNAIGEPFRSYIYLFEMNCQNISATPDDIAMNVLSPFISPGCPFKEVVGFFFKWSLE